MVVASWPDFVPLFVIKAQIGDSGAEGTTFRAERLRREGRQYLPTGDQVALKSFDRDAFWRDDDERSRDLAERLQDLEVLANVVSKVSGIVTFRSPFRGFPPQPPGATPDAASSEPRMYLPMELIEGVTLQYAITTTSDLAERVSLLSRFSDLATALQQMVAIRPDNPVAHRDIKPSNLILIDPPDGSSGMTLVDLGLLVGPQRSVTAGVGSFGFMAPEQQELYRLTPQLAHRVDWYAFYATVATTLAATPPPLRPSGYPAWLEPVAITSRAKQLIIDAVNAPPERRPAPWIWLPRLQEALDDDRKLAFRQRLIGRRGPRAALGVTALLLGATGSAFAVGAFHDNAAQPRTSIPATPPVSAQTPLRLRSVRRLAGCVSGTEVALPPYSGAIGDFNAFPANQQLLPAVSNAGGGGWVHSPVYLEVENPTARPLFVANVSFQAIGNSGAVPSPEWIYRPGPHECRPMPSADKTYRVDLQRSTILDTTGGGAHPVAAFPIPARGKVRLLVDAQDCGGNAKWDLLIKPEGGLPALHVDGLITFGRGLNTPVYVGAGGFDTKRQVVSHVTGKPVGC